MLLEEHLARLDAAYGIDRRSLQLILEQALEDQRTLEELAEKHSCELPAWLDLARTLENRRNQSSEAMERVITETMELDEAVFGTFSKADCVEVLRGLRDEVQRALSTRVEAAQFLVTIAGAYREGGYRRSEIVDGALKRVLAHLTNERGVSHEDATAYTAGLAAVCGILPLDLDEAAAALRTHLNCEEQQFPDLKSIFAASPGLPERQVEPGMTFAEVTNTVQQIALGLWPAGDRTDPAR